MDETRRTPSDIIGVAKEGKKLEPQTEQKNPTKKEVRFSNTIETRFAKLDPKFAYDAQFLEDHFDLRWPKLKDILKYRMKAIKKTVEKDGAKVIMTLFALAGADEQTLTYYQKSSLLTKSTEIKPATKEPPDKRNNFRVLKKHNPTIDLTPFNNEINRIVAERKVNDPNPILKGTQLDNLSAEDFKVLFKAINNLVEALKGNAKKNKLVISGDNSSPKSAKDWANNFNCRQPGYIYKLFELFKDYFIREVIKIDNGVNMKELTYFTLVNKPELLKFAESLVAFVKKPEEADESMNAIPVELKLFKQNINTFLFGSTEQTLENPAISSNFLENLSVENIESIYKATSFLRHRLTTGGIAIYNNESAAKSAADWTATLNCTPIDRFYKFYEIFKDFFQKVNVPQKNTAVLRKEKLKSSRTFLQYKIVKKNELLEVIDKLFSKTAA